MKTSELVIKIGTTIENILVAIIISIAFYITIPIDIGIDRLRLPKGSITNTVKYLQNRGFQLSNIDIHLLSLLGQPKHGELKINKGTINRIDFLHNLTISSEPIDIITLIPGETKTIFFQNISEKYGFKYEELNLYYDKYSQYKEAGIVPDTYHVPKGIKEDKLISFLINISEKRYEKMAKNYFNRYNKDEWRKYLIVASIIEKESANKEEMPIISSVIYNRLKINMPLQMDGTLNYGEYSHIKITPQRIKNDKSGFNTYIHKGLPPYPICSVSVDAIDASINPATTDYLYFMKNKQGVHSFTKSYREHIKNIKIMKK